MSDSRTVIWEGKKLNLREEEKLLDDKLLDLGLLEPDMTIQEKRDLASAVLESTRMAQEQVNQRERRFEDEKSKEKEDRERKQRELQKRKREHKGTREDDMREGMAKEELEKPVDISDDPVEVLDTCKQNEGNRKGIGEVMRGSFYGPSYLRDSKHPHPLSSEVYGSSKKNCLPRLANVNLMKLVEQEQQKKELKSTRESVKKSELLMDKPEREFLEDKESTSSKERDISFEDQSKHEEKNERVRNVRDTRDREEHTRSLAEGDKDESKKPFRKGERQWAKDTKKRGKGSKSSLVMTSGALSTLAQDVKLDKDSSVGNCEKRRRKEAESDNLSAEEDVREADGERKGKEEKNDLLSGEVKIPGGQKQISGSGQLTRRWNDVVISKNTMVPAVEGRDAEKEAKNEEKRMPNKRWRRVKRNFKSPYGSGSEVDEWISSEEERKCNAENLTKEQIVAKFDDCLMRMKDAQQKQCPNKADQGTSDAVNRCKRRIKLKVPPGFQEPDSDDDWNLWKICFADKSVAKGKSAREEINSDTVLSSSRISTRSRKKQEACPSPHSSSKSPSSVEEDPVIRNSPLHISSLKAILPRPSIHSNDENHSASKSPSLKEITLFDKVTCPIPQISKSTQTLWDDDVDSIHSSSSRSMIIRSTSNLKDFPQESKPMWDLLEVEPVVEDCDEVSKAVRINKYDEKLAVEDFPPNITTGCPRVDLRDSPNYLFSEHSEEDLEPPVPDEMKTLDDEGTSSTNTNQRSSGPSVARKIPAEELRMKMKKKSRRENVELEEVDLTSQEESLPEPITCPICSRAFPMSEIEAHASGCNPEEDDESSDGEAYSKERRDHRYRAGRVTETKPGGASHQGSIMDEEEDEEADKSDFEDSQEYGPKPPQLASFIPISQQTDSLIDYSDQFPHRSSGVNMQTSLERMRKSLMRGGKRKSAWRKKKRGKWRRAMKK